MRWTPAFAGMTTSLPQPLQRSTQPFGFRRLGLVVRPSLLDRFGLGALGEVRIGETLREAVAFLLGGGGGFVEGEFFPLRGRSRPSSGNAIRSTPPTTICADRAPPSTLRLGCKLRQSLQQAR